MYGADGSVVADWDSDSDVRAQMRRLVKKARFLMRGGYLEFAAGEATTPIDATIAGNRRWLRLSASAQVANPAVFAYISMQENPSDYRPDRETRGPIILTSGTPSASLILCTASYVR